MNFKNLIDELTFYKSLSKKHYKTHYYGTTIKKALGYADNDKNHIDDFSREVTSIKLVKRNIKNYVTWTKSPVNKYLVTFTIKK